MVNSRYGMADTFYMKVDNTYYKNWIIKKLSNIVDGDPITISSSEWYNTEDRKNKIFYNKDTYVLYANNYKSNTI